MADTLPDSAEQFIAQQFGNQVSQQTQSENSPELLKTASDELARLPPDSTAGYAAKREAQRVEELGKAPGVSLQEGLDPWSHLMTQMRRTKEDQIKYLAGKFGANNVRLNELQEPVVRIEDPETKKPKDIVINPHTINLNDLVTVGSYAPEVVGSILALRFGGGPIAEALGGVRTAGTAAKLGKLGEALLGGAGAETVGGLKDIATQTYDKGGPDIGEIASERGKAAVVDAALARGIDVAAAKPLQMVYDLLKGRGLPNPFANRISATPELSEAGKQGARRLAGKHRQEPVEFSAGEASGWPALQMAEAYSEAQPAGTTPLVKAKARQDEAIRKLQNAMLDPASLPSDEEITRKGLGALEDSLKPAAQRVEKTRDQIAKETTDRILNTMKVSDIPTKGVPKAQSGNLIQQGALARREQFFNVNNINYNNLFSHPLATANVIDGDLVADPISHLMKSLPKVERTVASPSGPVTQEELLQKQIKPGLLGRLEELASLKGGKISLQTLKQVRTDIDDAIKVGEAVPGVKEGFLKQARGAVSNAIEQGIDQIGDPTLRDLYKTANSYYKNNVEKFTEKNIATLFKDASQASSIGGSQFVDNLISSPDKYKALRTFLGATSPEIEALHKTVSQNLLHESLADGVSKTVDGATLVKKLVDLRKQNPEMFNAVFGSKGKAVIENAKALGTVQGKLDLEDVAKAIDPKSPAGLRLDVLRYEEENRARQFNNDVVKKYLSGGKTADDVNADDLIRYLPSVPLSNVRQVVSRISTERPEIIEQMQRKTLQSILQDAARTSTPEDVLRSLQGEKSDIVSGVAIKKVLGRGDQMEKYKALLGPELYQDLEDYTKIELVREKKRILAAGTGILTKGQAIGSFYRALQPGEHGSATMGKEIAGVAWNKAVATVLANRTMRRWLTSAHTLEDMPRVSQAIIASEPFIKATLEEFPNDLPGAYQYLSFLKQAVGLGAKQTDKTPEQKIGAPLPANEADFLKQQFPAQR